MGLTKAEIEALKTNFDPMKGPQTVDEWLYLGGNSLNVLNNLAVANGRLANAIATALNNQKSLVEDVADTIDLVAELKIDIDRFKPVNTSNFEAKSGLGATIDEARSLYSRLIAQIDLKDSQKNLITTALAKGEIPQLMANDYQIIGTQLQTRNESLTTVSQQESVRLQTLTSRYTQANEQATTVQQKDSQSKSGVANNLRGSG
jgi:hypothetical protein